MDRLEAAHLKFWDIVPGKEKLRNRIRRSVRRLMANPPEGYRFELTDGSETFLPTGDEIYFVAGTSWLPLGYAHCYQSKPAQDVGIISKLPELDRVPPYLFDASGNPVAREALKIHDGYSAYTGRGALLCISLIDIFRQGTGTGSRLMDYVKSHGYELIELEANGPKQIRFFSRNGFIDTGIRSDEGIQTVMVWNSPAYRAA